ncbi:MAG: hypothetical protein IJ560_03365 [Alphaproteobacteria bacterium]|nr:hypothetical protein [Alphaproteobacteria bacterium]
MLRIVFTIRNSLGGATVNDCMGYRAPAVYDGVVERRSVFHDANSTPGAVWTAGVQRKWDGAGLCCGGRVTSTGVGAPPPMCGMFIMGISVPFAIVIHAQAGIHRVLIMGILRINSGKCIK